MKDEMMLRETVGRLGSDIVDLHYKLDFLEEQVAKLTAEIIELKTNRREDD